MLTLERIEHVRRLLRSGLSDNSIAQGHGLSRSTVRKIRLGQLSTNGRKIRAITERERELRKQERDSLDRGGAFQDLLPTPIRCKHCGGKIVQSPCVVCGVQEILDDRKLTSRIRKEATEELLASGYDRRTIEANFGGG